jgi:hypothetical protein
MSTYFHASPKNKFFYFYHSGILIRRNLTTNREYIIGKNTKYFLIILKIISKYGKELKNYSDWKAALS